MEVTLNVRMVDGVPVLDVAGELDIYTSPKLKSAMADLLGEGHARFIVNLVNTTYLDSTALSVLTAALKQSQASGGNVGLIYTQPQIEKIFTITGLHEVFPIFRSEPEAVRTAQSWAKSAPSS